MSHFALAISRRDRGSSEIFQPTSPHPSASAPAPSVYDPFGLLYEPLASYAFQFVSLTATGSVLFLSRFLSAVSLFFPSFHPPSSLLCAFVTGYSATGNDASVHLGKSSVRCAVYDHLEFQFLGGQNTSVIGSQKRSRLFVPEKSYGRLSCSCSRCKLARNRSLVPINERSIVGVKN